MNYVTDQNGNYILDENGNKIEFSVSYSDGDWYIHREGILISDDGHLDTEDRHLIVKDGISLNHAVSKKHLDQLNTNIKEYIDNKLSVLQNSINTSINILKSQINELQNLNFRNDKTNNHITPNFNNN